MLMAKMKRMSSYNSNRGWFVVLLAVVFLASVAQADRPGWESQDVDLRISGGARIKSVKYPPGTRLPLLTRRDGYSGHLPETTILHPDVDSGFSMFTQMPAGAAIAYVIDSSPLNGFVPWIAVAVTDEGAGELELDAVSQSSVVGRRLVEEPETAYGIGIFDTGASTHIISSDDALRTGLLDYKPSLITDNPIEVLGVTGTATMWVSQPLGLFIGGLNAIDPNGLKLDETVMIGQTNVSVGVGDPIESPNVPTVVGSPMSVFFTAVLRNDKQITIVRDGEEFTGPEITLFQADDPEIPDYSGRIPLELRPSGSVAVQYFPDILDPFGSDFGSPMSPSAMTSFLPSQSLFFASSVDLAFGSKSAIDKDGFMVDTGAQVTVISETIAARLGLRSDDAAFEVEIVGVTGDSIMAPVFVIDSLDITAAPDWLSFTNIPVVMLDVDSPEGGVMDGIIGMNLFNTFNLVLRGGGLPDYGGHRLDFEPIAPKPIGDIAPGIGDGIVDLRDINALADLWLITPASLLWNPSADIAPQGAPDGIINFLDFALIAEHWLATTER
ncbi:MAG TPA: hypothetical protein DIU00_00165 [Phycisphaerales bacterium]|nr:hypothetical protein [Phycisphaerales bacterium]